MTLRQIASRLTRLETRAISLAVPMVATIARIIVHPGENADAKVAAELERIGRERGRPFKHGREPLILLRQIVKPPARP